MSSRNPFKIIGIQRDEPMKTKLGAAIKRIEIHRRELENMRGKLAERRKLLYDTTVRAMMAKDKSKATVYANEWAELRKVTKVVYVSELALTQVILRLESIDDVGDVMAHMSEAFKVLKKVNKEVQGLAPALDEASKKISDTLTETMAEMGNVSPTIDLNFKTESGQELVEQAQKYAEEQAEKMKRSLSAPTTVAEKRPEEVEARVPLLASGEQSDEESILGILYASPKEESATEEQVLKYASIHDGKVDVTDASSVLNIPPDDVENAMLKLVSDGRVKLIKSGGKQE